ncbi:hypothetical protein [Streptomyces sp. NPDC047315]|uniref:WXG100 family type VII secretion target n=1 Tax=Streptomyces sp. NPDC047315 TaxID=3155142 RepID=UPI0033FF91A7
MTEQDKGEQELTPEQQEKQDLARAQTQNKVADITRVVTSIFGGNGVLARTDFEGHDLNVMIDLVENSKPVDLESAGDSLRKARDGLKSAGEQLKTEVAGVRWEGQGAEAFREFGNALAAHAVVVSTFAGIAATQITAAGMGLASVRGSMPPRDTRVVKHDVRKMPTPEQVDTNPDYVAAKKVEQDRQEAINQMNRLASYYAVSEQALANQEPPRFEGILKSDVPRPKGERFDPPPSRRRSAVSDSRTASIQPVGRRGEERRSQGERPTEIPGTPPPANVERDPSTVIDGVAPPVASPPTNPNSAPPVAPVGPVAPPTGPTGTPPVAPISPVGPVTGPVTGKTVGPVPTSPVSKAMGGPGKTSGTPPFTATGQPGVPGRPSITGTPTATPSTNSPVGRPSGPMTGGPSNQGPVGRTGGPGAAGPYTNNQQQMLGRPNTTGGPVSGQPTTGRANSGPAGTRHGQGIIGGTAQRPTGGPAGSRVPRGTVIGAEGPGTTRPTQGRTGQSGVVGANSGNAARPTGRGTPSVNGVVGAPRQGSSSNARPGKSGFTTGGSGLVGGRPGRKRSDKDEEENESTRPDYLTEDEETWTAGRRDTTPPVID